MISAAIGDVLLGYDSAVTLNTMPPLGVPVWSTKLSAWVAFVKNAGATSLVAGDICLATGTDAGLGQVRISGTAGGELMFAGVRPAGSATLTQNQFGYIIVEGPAAGVNVGGTDVSAANMAVVSGTTAGYIQAYSGANTNATTDYTALLLTQGIFGYSTAASAASVAPIIVTNSIIRRRAA